MNQRGFATLEVILMVMVIGILASVAVPRFNEVTTAANTAKIQSDLSTIDTAISLYYMDKGEYPTAMSQLDEYLRDADKIKPPKGEAYINGTATKISATVYAITPETGKESRATLDNHKAGDFYKTATSSSGSSSGEDIG